MGHPKLDASREGPRPPQAPSVSPGLDRRSTAFARLQRAYRAARPFAILTAETPTCTRSLLEQLLAEVAADSAVVRLQAPFKSPRALIRRVVAGLDFQSEGLTQTDLENVLKMFLGYQQNHQARTLICLEEAGEADAWVQAYLDELLELDAAGPQGLTVIVTGRPELHAYVEAARPAKVGEIEVVDESSKVHATRRLVFSVNGKFAREIELRQRQILIGRDKLCNVRFVSPSVSRRHALLVNVANGIAIVDLSSTNGTLVDKRPVRYCHLPLRGQLSIGDYEIAFEASEDKHRWTLDISEPASVPIHKVGGETQTLQRTIKGNINRKGEKIYHVPGSACYEQTRIDEAAGERWFFSEEEALDAGWRAARR